MVMHSISGTLASFIACVVFTLHSSAAPAQQPLTLGIHPYLSSTEIHKRFTPLADYLGKALGRPVSIHIESSYENHVAAVGTGKADLAFMGPASYVKLTRAFGEVPLLAAFETKGSRTFKGVIAVRRDSPVTELTQLRGRKFAFGDVNSTMSHLVPRSMLLKAGVDVQRLAKAEFLTNHDNIALGVLSGNFDAGAMKEDVFTQYAPQGLRALAISESMPDHLFVARRGLPAQTVRRISEILISLNNTEEGRLILGTIQKTLTALVPVRDADYDRLRELLVSLEKAGVKP